MPSIMGLFKELQTLVSIFFNLISALPLHIYYTALPNTPTTTLLYQAYAPTLFTIEASTLQNLKTVEAAVDEVKQ